MVNPSPLWSTPIQYAKGVGPRRARLLEKLGVFTIEDAFWFVPWRYDDRLEVLPIKNLLPGMKATIKGHIEQCRMQTTSRRRLVIVTITVRDETGVIDCIFFNQPYLEQTFVEGVPVLVTGTVSHNPKGLSQNQIKGPEYEILDSAGSGPDEACGRIIPVYHETHGLSSKQLRRIIQSIFEHYAQLLQEILPGLLRERFGLPTLFEALPLSA